MVEPVKLLPCKLCGNPPTERDLRESLDLTDEIIGYCECDCPQCGVYMHRSAPEESRGAWNALMSHSSREAVLEEALRDIARQELRGEMSRSDQAYADWEVGFELCVGRARTALSAPAVSPESNPGKSVADETKR